MFSAAPAMLRTASGLTSMVDGETGAGFKPAVTTTSSLNWDRLSSRISKVTGCSPTADVDLLRQVAVGRHHQARRPPRKRQREPPVAVRLPRSRRPP